MKKLPLVLPMVFAASAMQTSLLFAQDGSVFSCSLITQCERTSGCGLPQSFRVVAVGEVFQGGEGKIFFVDRGSLKEMRLINQDRPDPSAPNFVVSDFTYQGDGIIRFFGTERFVWVQLRLTDPTGDQLSWPDQLFPKSLDHELAIGTCGFGWK